MRQTRKWTSVSLGLLLAGCVFSAGLIAFYFVAAPSLQSTARLQQRSRAIKVQRDLQASLDLSAQIARSTARLVGPIRTDVGQVEHTLTEMLIAAPPQTVYGIGAWYEPNVFTPTAALFGPYVHRQSFSDPTPVLTYEWTTPEYNFPTQPWYLAGKTSNGQTRFTEPYFDTDLVYMSIVAPFSDTNGRFTGEVTVDLVLPQLRDLILQANDTSAEVIYVLTESGAIFAHPDEQRLLEFARAQGQQPQSLLDINADDLKSFIASGPAGRRHTAAMQQNDLAIKLPQTGWTVHIASDPSYLFADSRNLLRLVLLAILGIWICIVGVLLILRRSRSRILSAEASAAQGQRRSAELFNFAPYPIFLLDATRNRFTLANTAAQKFYGYSADEFASLPLNAILAHAEAADSIPSAYREGSANGLFADQHRRHNGEIADVLVRTQYIDIDGRHVLQCYIIDITDQKQAETQLAEQRAMIAAQANALAHAVTPLIPISDQILAAPLVGAMDAERAAKIVRLIAEGVESSNARAIIVDVTGVAMIDVDVARLLIRAARIVQLLGAQMVITGVKPDVAQVLVALDVDLASLATYSTLQSGISHTLASLR